MTNYKQAKDKTRAYSEWVRVMYRDNKLMIKDSLDIYLKDISEDFNLNSHERNLLSNYVCKLHP